MPDINMHLMEICPFRLGSKVKIKPYNKYASEWRGVYVVTGMQWEYQSGPSINISIASDDDIQTAAGSTDGWSPDDLMPAG